MLAFGLENAGCDAMKFAWESCLRFAACAAVIVVGVRLAQADTLTSTGEGSCLLGGSCNNTDPNALSNTAAGSDFGNIVANWFAFDLPNLGKPITSASLSVFNDGNDITQNSTAVYNLYAATGFTFADLTGGTSLGSDPLASADTGVSHFENIAINSAGLALLNSEQGTQILLGGGVDGASTTLIVEIFGFTQGSPAATLTVSTVPEPQSNRLNRYCTAPFDSRRSAENLSDCLVSCDRAGAPRPANGLPVTQNVLR